MTQEEILEYNKRCAEFLNWRNLNDDSFPEFITPMGDFYPAKNLVFDSDWNWIMDVVEKIESLIFQKPVPDTYYEVRLVGSVYVYIGSNNGDELITVDNQTSKKEAVIQAINQFLIWYNNEPIN